ncbi:MAG: hypothetical protein AB7K09_06095 [Planctomycetota bacterium]
MTLNTSCPLFDRLDSRDPRDTTTTPPATESAVLSAAAISAASEAAASHPADSRDEFTRAIRSLVRARLRGEIDFQAFAVANLELHFRYGRPGYTHADFERDIAEYQERTRQRPSDGRLRPIRWVTRALENGPVQAG